jgi:hypothetical protein
MPTYLIDAFKISDEQMRDVWSDNDLEEWYIVHDERDGELFLGE